MTYKNVLLCAVSVMLGGCGSAQTLFSYDETIRRTLKKKHTYCESIPRLYSGVAFDLCLLNALPNTSSGVPVGFVPIFFFDVFASAAVDTVVSPYTLYRQYKYGSILLRSY